MTEDEIYYMQNDIYELTDMVAKLKRDNAVLMEEKEMLDWIERKKVLVSYQHDTPLLGEYNMGESYIILLPPDDREIEGKTLRSAIKSAMKEDMGDEQ